MTDVHLNGTDAMELAEILLFVRDWLRRDDQVIATSFADFVGIHSYPLTELREDLTRFAFLLGGDHEESFLSRDVR